MKNKKTGAGGEIYSNPEDDKISSHYGLDIEEQLTKMLTDELTKSIDRDILMSLGLEDRNRRRKNSINKIFKND